MTKKNAYPESAEKFRATLERLKMTKAELAAALEMGERHLRKFAIGECLVPKVVWLAIDSLRRSAIDKRRRRFRAGVAEAVNARLAPSPGRRG